MQSLAFLLSFLFAINAWAGPAPLLYVICKLKGNVRTLRVEVDAQNICHTIYSKEGVDKSVGSGKNHESCKTFAENIKVNLGKSNWTCRDVANATASDGT